MFEFTTTKGQVTVSDGDLNRDWVLNMPKFAERGGPTAAATPAVIPLPAAPVSAGARAAHAAIAVPMVNGLAAIFRDAAGRVRGVVFQASRNRDFRVPRYEPLQRDNRPTRRRKRRRYRMPTSAATPTKRCWSTGASAAAWSSQAMTRCGGNAPWVGEAVREDQVDLVDRAARFRRPRAYR
jgi:hypothetical protein